MSASTTRDPFDLEEQLTQIRRAQAETRKFAAEQNKLAEEAGKLTAEQNKLAAEQNKMVAETLKLNRDRWLAPVIAVASVTAAVGATVTALATIFRLAGRS